MFSSIRTSTVESVVTAPSVHAVLLLLVYQPGQLRDHVQAAVMHSVLFAFGTVAPPPTPDAMSVANR